MFFATIPTGCLSFSFQFERAFCRLPILTFCSLNDKDSFLDLLLVCSFGQWYLLLYARRDLCVCVWCCVSLSFLWLHGISAPGLAADTWEVALASSHPWDLG